MRRRKRRWPWILLLLIAGGAGGWWYYTRENPADAAPEYETVKIARGDLTKFVSATGELNPLVKVEIGSQISGTISKLNVDFNSVVKEGDILCELDPATYEANYAQTRAERSSAEAERDLQRRSLERKKQLIAKQLLSVADFDKVESDLRRAEAQLELTEARLKKAKVDLDRCRILSPINGVVVDRTAEIGQTIAASFSAPKLFMMAADLTKMQINAKVSEADIGQIHEKQKVKFEVDAYPDSFFGEVVQVRNSPIAEENVVNYDVIIAVNNPDMKLKPGMTAIVQIITGERSAVLRVPNGALRFRPASKNGAAAAGGPPSGGPRGGGGGGGGGPSPDAKGPGFKPKQATDEKQLYLKPANPKDELVALKVKTGLSDGVQTEILSGLNEGDEVVLLQKPKKDEAAGTTNPFSGGMGGGRR
ncbi:MAG: efflux RND transporter periplasmic adaptor subunit [Verrucomicrobiota bacterium]